MFSNIYTYDCQQNLDLNLLRGPSAEGAMPAGDIRARKRDWSDDSVSNRVEGIRKKMRSDDEEAPTCNNVDYDNAENNRKERLQSVVSKS